MITLFLSWNGKKSRSVSSCLLINTWEHVQFRTDSPSTLISVVWLWSFMGLLMWFYLGYKPIDCLFTHSEYIVWWVVCQICGACTSMLGKWQAATRRPHCLQSIAVDRLHIHAQWCHKLWQTLVRLLWNVHKSSTTKSVHTTHEYIDGASYE